MSSSSIYTYSERTVRKYSVYQAEESARRRLAERGHKGPICVNACRGQPANTKITLEELNRIADGIFRDTLYNS